MADSCFHLSSITMPEKIPLLLALVLSLGLFPNSPLLQGGENWPQFRGPAGLGLSDEKNLPLQWGGAGNENVIWQSPLRGSGHASPVVWGDAVFVCTVQWPGDGAPQAEVMPEHHVACYNAVD